MYDVSFFIAPDVGLLGLHRMTPRRGRDFDVDIVVWCWEEFFERPP